MRSVTLALVLVTACAGFLPPVARASGGSKMEPPPMPQEAPLSPEQQAMELYNSGLAQRDSAWKLEDKLASAPPDKRAKLEGKIEQAYKGAIEDFRAAIDKDARMHQAYGNLGYAYRRTGDYRAALEAYDAALRLKPDYVEALEYRGEAYLGLNRLDDAKASYETLAKAKPPLAAELAGAMRSWIDARRRDPAGTKVGELDELERWVDERQAGVPPAPSSLHKQRTW